MNKFQICFNGVVVNVICNLNNPIDVYNNIIANKGVLGNDYYFPDYNKIIAIAKTYNLEETKPREISEEEIKDILKSIK